jgi:hypothetical protein
MGVIDSGVYLTSSYVLTRWSAPCADARITAVVSTVFYTSQKLLLLKLKDMFESLDVIVEPITRAEKLPISLSNNQYTLLMSLTRSAFTITTVVLTKFFPKVIAGSLVNALSIETVSWSLAFMSQFFCEMICSENRVGWGRFYNILTSNRVSKSDDLSFLSLLKLPPQKIFRKAFDVISFYV